MPKHSVFLYAFGLTAPALALGCSAEDIGAGTAGSGPTSPPVTVGGSGGSTGIAGSAPAPVAGSRASGGGPTLVLPNGGSGGGLGGVLLDGGEFPASPEVLEKIRAEKCAGWEAEPEEVPSSIMLVMDNSSSMNRKSPGSENLSKWDVTREALLLAVPGTPPTTAGLPAAMGVGLLFYPNLRTNVTPNPAADLRQCLNIDAMVPVQQLGEADGVHRTLVRTAIQTATLNRGTMTHDAYKYAFENGIMKSNILGERYMVLVTDGTPTVLERCVNAAGNAIPDVDPEPIVGEITRVAQMGIKTFLIGSPGSEKNRPWMSRAAKIGGTALEGCTEAGPNWCHMDMTEAPNFADALRDGLARIVGAVAPCQFDPPEVEGGAKKIDRALTNVTYSSPKLNNGNPVVVVRDDIGECTKGWRLVNEDKVELCPETCKAVQNDLQVLVKVSYGCESIVGPPE